MSNIISEKKNPRETNKKLFGIISLFLAIALIVGGAVIFKGSKASLPKSSPSQTSPSPSTYLKKEFQNYQAAVAKEVNHEADKEMGAELERYLRLVETPQMDKAWNKFMNSVFNPEIKRILIAAKLKTKYEENVSTPNKKDEYEKEVWTQASQTVLPEMAEKLIEVFKIPEEIQEFARNWCKKKGLGNLLKPYLKPEEAVNH